MNSPIQALDPSKINSSTPIKRKSQATPISYRLMICYRFALALIGGYLLASLSAIVTAQYFADYKGSAAMSATLIAFTLWACAFIWVFMINKTLKASLGIFIPVCVLFICYKMMGN